MAEESRYYIMAAENPDRMLLYSMPDLPDDLNDDWLFGRPFSVEPEEPVRVMIQERFEKKLLLPFFDHPPLVSDEFLQALREAGVDNVVAYDAEIYSEDERIIHRGYKAINIIGVIEAAAAGTVFTGDSRSFDAAIEGLEIDPKAARDVLMFRLAENLSAVVVHERVKKAIEARNFHSVVFREPETFVSI